MPNSNTDSFLLHLDSATEDQQMDYFLTHAYHDMRFFYKTITQYQATSFVYFGDMQKNLFYISNNMRDLFGFKHNLVQDFIEKWKSRIHGERCLKMFEENFREIIEKKSEVHDIRYQVSDKDGNIFWIRCCGSIQWSEDKTQPLFFAGRVTRQDESFTVDPVTNFPSADTLQRHLAILANSTHIWRTIGFRFNNIPHINTLYGRNVADHLIGDICYRLMDELGDKMTFYRLPGVRCFALVHYTITEPIEDLIEGIQKIVNAGYRSVNIQVAEPCSVAVMDFPQNGLSEETFMENMVSLIKIAHREPLLPYVKDTQQNLDRIHRLSNMEMVIAQDVVNNMANFRPVIQPIVSTQTGKIIAGETLMRWKYEGSDVSPGIFIPALEKSRLIYIAGRWILEQAVKICSEIIRYLPDFYLSVNLSLQQLYDEELMNFIPYVLEKYHLEGRHLVIEITESCMDLEPAKLRKLMELCDQYGVRMALDDFGTGYSSLRVLMQYPTNIIKLDRTLLMEMTESADKTNFITSIVFACHQFGKKVCMEGVEDHNQRVLTQDAQCDMIQGFYFYRPSEIDTLYDIIRQEAHEK